MTELTPRQMAERDVIDAARRVLGAWLNEWDVDKACESLEKAIATFDAASEGVTPDD